MSANRPRVYVETTIDSYLTARPSRDIVIAGHQESTRVWWENVRPYFELVTSDTVRDEAGKGDPLAARERREALRGVTILNPTPDVLKVAEELVGSGAVPAKVPEDALHIAFAAVWKIPYLLTWNMKHLLNPVMQPRIHAVCEGLGFTAPVICTPEALRKETL